MIALHRGIERDRRLGERPPAVTAPRRVVTGHDPSGRSTVLADGTSPSSRSIPGATFHELWNTTETPAQVAPAELREPTDRPLVTPPDPNGTIIRIVDLEPGSRSPMHRTETMRERGYGRIVNIASIAGKDGNPNMSAYSASKAGVIALTKSAGKELARTGILVNCVVPAVFDTGLTEAASAEERELFASLVPMGRMGQPEELAELVAWLASDRCSFSTGASFDVSGGRAVY